MPISQAQNDGFNVNSKEISASIENVCPEGTGDQSVKSSNGEDLVWDVHVRSS